ncbi:MAG: hypothetical protein M1818_005221 [Claussenomyces sp. TS43310]|nr:MAG: hypothetical protein M1818_005221 [Claussenomyces sp. TS43310]
MPDTQLTVATYAAGASLAAITLIYVFAPTYFIDGDAPGSSSSKKRGAIGLTNPANDCFINSTLQALAGLGDLRIYLIRETHRRNLDGETVYADLVEDPARKSLPKWKLDGLQKGIVTQGLKDMLDALNERPLCKKTISATPFVVSLEVAFRQRISRQQQDAQEFLQVVAERLCDEYHAGHRARRRWRDKQVILQSSQQNVPLDENTLERQLSRLAMEDGVDPAEAGVPQIDIAVDVTPSETDKEPSEQDEKLSSKSRPNKAISDASSRDPLQDPDLTAEEGFPLEGQSESQIECMTCGFKPKPSQSTFCTLSLNVPQVSSTSLSACFDGMFKTEYIEDFKCEKCRLVHAVENLEQEMTRLASKDAREVFLKNIEKLKTAINDDPETPPSDVVLPDSKHAPKRKIARHVKITKFPKILAIHLSRSIFDVGRSSLKNSAKVQFPERLPLGGLLDQKKYKLLGVVTHKGSHHSGHYESFRRQNIQAPFSTPHAFDKSGVYSKSATPAMSVVSTPRFDGAARPSDTDNINSTPSELSPLPPAVSSPQSGQSFDSLSARQNGRSETNSSPILAVSATSAPRDPDTTSLRSVARSARSTISKVPSTISHSLSRSSTPRSSNSSPPSPLKGKEKGSDSVQTPTTSVPEHTKAKRKKAGTDKWWRISDERVKESKTSEVLAMQKEVYLLFYELQRTRDIT